MNLYENIKDNLKENYGSERSISAYLEEQIPYNMRYKVCNTISSDDARKKTLYWVTQEFFTEEDLNKFVEALKNVAYDDAYITVRDLSVYDFNTDLKNGVLIHIKNGANGFVEGFDKYWEEGKNYFDEEPMNESEEDYNNYEDWTDKEIVQDIIDNFKEITGIELKDIFNYDPEKFEGGWFNQDVIDKSTGIKEYLVDKGLDRGRIDDLWYKLDDALISYWYNYQPKDFNSDKSRED